MKNLIMLGAPGSGKGTMATKLVDELGLVHISTGDLLRHEVQEETELGLSIKDIMNKGELVTDEIISKLLEKRISEPDCKEGYILDGFPRNVTQISIIEKLMPNVTAIVEMDVDFDIIVERMAGRRQCKSCGATYNMKNFPPKVEGICDKCGEELIVRNDDKPEVVLSRLESYKTVTYPVVEHYKNGDNFLSVPAMEIDKQVEIIKNFVQERSGK